VLLAFGIVLQAADDISAREILAGFTEIFPRHAEVLGGTAMVVAAMVMMTMMTMMAVVTMVMVVTMVVVVVVVVVVIEQIVQETSDETSRKTWQQTEHELFSIVARGACACLMPTLRCLLTV
jgi:Ca2+/Na+ antiporter